MSRRVAISPDPTHRLGGHAIARVEGLELRGQSVSIEIRDRYSDRLLGLHGWQSARVEVGPVEIRSDGQGQYLCLGPEVVDRMEEFLTFELTVAGETAEGVWPGDVAQSPSKPKQGAVLTRSGKKAPLETEPEIEYEPATEKAADAETPGREPWPYLVAALVILALVGGAGYWYFESHEPGEITFAEIGAEETGSETLASVDPCSSAGLTAGGRSYAQALEAISSCREVTSDAAMSVLEWGEAAGSAEAALTLGYLYDPEIEDPVFEQELGISMEPRPDLAIAQYAKAAELGSPRAVSALAAVCVTLATRDDSLSQIAHEDHCQEESSP